MNVRHAFFTLFFATVPASAQTVIFSEPASGTALFAGDLVEVRWSGVPREAREVELLLSVDGGGHFDIRITEELAADSGRFLLRVPNLSTNEAAFALRAGIRGREVTSAPGPVFAIVADVSVPRLALAWRAGEIWIAEDDREEPRGLPGADFHPTPPAMSALEDSPDAAECPRSRAAVRADTTVPMILSDASRPLPPLGRSASRAPLSVPPRI